MCPGVHLTKCFFSSTVSFFSTVWKLYMSWDAQWDPCSNLLTVENYGDDTNLQKFFLEKPFDLWWFERPTLSVSISVAFNITWNWNNDDIRMNLVFEENFDSVLTHIETISELFLRSSKIWQELLIMKTKRAS